MNSLHVPGHFSLFSSILQRLRHNHLPVWALIAPVQCHRLGQYYCHILQVNTHLTKKIVPSKNCTPTVHAPGSTSRVTIDFRLSSQLVGVVSMEISWGNLKMMNSGKVALWFEHKTRLSCEKS